MFVPINSISSIYNDKTLFITGGTGYVGKALVEKLLYECSSIRRIYLLIRDRKNSTASDRLVKYMQDPVFVAANRVPLELLKEKLWAISGDIAIPGLGLSESDRDLLKNETNIFINCAASVNLVEPLYPALKSNVQSVISVVELAKEMTSLESLIHVSTCYVNMHQCNGQRIEERVYPTVVTAEHMLELTKWMDTDQLQKFAFKDGRISEGRPNGYTFSKALAEDYIRRKAQDIPISIVRLSLVGPSMKDPVPGFVETPAGGTFGLLLNGLGFLQGHSTRPDTNLDYIQVDYAANFLIAVAAQMVVNEKSHQRLFHCTLKGESSRKHVAMCTEINRKNPMMSAFRPVGNLTKSKSRFGRIYNRIVNDWLILYLYHILAMVMIGRKFDLMGKMRKVREAQVLTELVSTRNLDMDDTNFSAMYETLSAKDRETFPFRKEYDRNDYYTVMTAGVKFFRKWVLKEDVSDINKAIKHHQMLLVIDYSLKIFLFATIALLSYFVSRLVF